MPCFRMKKRSAVEKIAKNGTEDSTCLRRLLKRVSTLSSTIISFLRDIRADIYKLLGLTGRLENAYVHNAAENGESMEIKSEIEHVMTIPLSEVRGSISSNRSKRKFTTTANYRQNGDGDSIPNGRYMPAEQAAQTDDFNQIAQHLQDSIKGQCLPDWPKEKFITTSQKYQQKHVNTSIIYNVAACGEFEGKCVINEIVQAILSSQTNTTVTKESKLAILKMLVKEHEKVEQTGQPAIFPQQSDRLLVEIYPGGIFKLQDISKPDLIGETHKPHQSTDQKIGSVHPERFLDQSKNQNLQNIDTVTSGKLTRKHTPLAPVQIAGNNAKRNTSRPKKPVLTNPLPVSKSDINKTIPNGAIGPLPNKININHTNKQEQEKKVTTEKKENLKTQEVARIESDAITKKNNELIQDPEQLEANKARFTKMLQRMIQHSIVACRERKWKFRIELVVAIYLRPNGEYAWSPVYKDCLYPAGSKAMFPSTTTWQCVEIIRDASVASYIQDDGTIPVVTEEVGTTRTNITLGTKTTKRNSTKTEHHSITNDEIKRWMDLIDAMAYVAFYIMIKQQMKMNQINSPSLDTSEKRRMVQDFVSQCIKKFKNSNDCLTPQMRNAVNQFALSYDDDGVFVDTGRDNLDLFSEEGADNAQAEAPIPEQANKSNRRERRNSSSRRSNDRQNTLSPNRGRQNDVKNTVSTRIHVSGNSGSDTQPAADDTTETGAGNTQDDQMEDETNFTVGPDQDGYHEMGKMNNVLTADVNRIVEWEYADYVNPIETNNTLDLNCLEVVAGHGERPNKKKLASEIKEKKKTKGIPNKHLEQANKNHSYDDCEDNGNDVTEENADIDGAPQAEGGAEAPEEPMPLEMLEVLEQKLDDRELNMVPEEVIRKDESKLKDLEDEYTLSSSEKKKDKYRKKREKKPKGVKLMLDFDFPDHKRR